MKKAIRHIARWGLLTTVFICLLPSLLLRVPAIQTVIAERVGETLSEEINSKVHIGNVDIRLPNRLIVDDVEIWDQKQKLMLKAGRMSVSVDVLSLVRDGNISISSAQLFATKVFLYKETKDSPLNCQYMIDSLSTDSESEEPFNLRISSLVIRNGEFCYDEHYVPEKKGRFSPSHLKISKISANMMLKEASDDKVDVEINKLSFREASGLSIDKLMGRALYESNGEKSSFSLHNFSLSMPRSSIEIPELIASYNLKGGEIDNNSIVLKTKVTAPQLSFKDVEPFMADKTADGLPDISIFTDVNVVNSSMNAMVDAKALSGGAFVLKTDIAANNIFDGICVRSNIHDLHISSAVIDAIAKNTDIPKELRQVGDIDLRGKLSMCNGQTYNIDAIVGTTEIGNAEVKALLEHGGLVDKFTAKIMTAGLKLSNIPLPIDLDYLSGKVELDGGIRGGKEIDRLKVKGAIDKVVYSQEEYQNIQIDGDYSAKKFTGDIAVNDPNIHFNVNMDGVVNLNSIDDAECHVNVSDIYIREKDAHIDNVFLSIDKEETGERNIRLSTDFAEVTMKGDFKPTTLPATFLNLLSGRLTKVPGLGKYEPTDNRFSIEGYVRNTDFLKKMVDIPVVLRKPAVINGYIDDRAQSANLLLNAPWMLIGEREVKNTTLQILTPQGSLNASLNSTLLDGKDSVDIHVDCDANDDKLVSSITWDNKRKNVFKGSLNTCTSFYRTIEGDDAFNIVVPDSWFEIGDTVWTISSDGIEYSKNKLDVTRLNVGNDNQHLYINGIASKSEQDSLVVELKNIDVSYILNLLNFHSVEFDGAASGRVVANSVFDKLNAEGNLRVDDFLFQNGRMGVLNADATYSNEKQRIDIDAVADDVNISGKTLINGFISPQHNNIELNIKAENTRLEFMQDFSKSFLKDVDLYGDGEVTLGGDFSHLELLGKLVAHGHLTVISTNCRYVLPSDTIRLIPDDIVFDDVPIQDIYGNTALVSGGIHHKHLGRMSYDILAKTDRLLAYDVPTFDGNSFCGRAVIKGNVGIHGKGNDLNINARATTLSDSYIIYNTTSPDAIISQDFITWGSAKEGKDSVLVVENKKEKEETKSSAAEQSTNIRMNFLVTATPEARLHLFMDALTGDYIDLYGSGDLRISYYNKGTFDIFGNYNIDNGLYRMTIQNIMRRDFQFQNGSQIAFGGDPFEAILRMKALYQLNSVSLSDLNIGSSFKTNNVPVNCIMNISGTAGRPLVEFNLDLPSLGSDVRQMVYSVINSEESMNQQVLYLLAIGRFYPNDSRMNETEEHVGQTSLAMQSFLSGTFSQQLNQVIGNLIRNNNWSFGTNIATGTDGLSNAEYEGTLSGRMLNNRLVFNGQFGYRNNVMTQNANFIGDFDIQYLLTPNGNVSLKMYNQANDRYFTKNSLNTQGLGIILKKEFTLRPWFRRRYGSLKD